MGPAGLASHRGPGNALTGLGCFELCLKSRTKNPSTKKWPLDSDEVLTSRIASCGAYRPTESAPIEGLAFRGEVALPESILEG